MLKECKVRILKRMLYLEEKYKKEGYISPFSHYEALLTASNIAIWRTIKRGIITPEDVRLAIYQLENAKLIEIINRKSIRLTDKGRMVARKIRPMSIEQIPNELLEGNLDAQEILVKKESKICPNCGYKNRPDANFCASCGTKLQKKIINNCPYCGFKIDREVNFCPNCGASLD